MNRREEAIRKWLPLVAISSIISFSILVLLKIPIERAAMASGLLILLIFSGFFFRSFGRDRSQYDGEKK